MSTPFDERVKHPNFPQPKHIDSLVWRYITLQKLISLLSSNSLYLARLDSLNDPHEGSYPKQMIDYRDSVYKSEGQLEFLPQHVWGNKLNRTCSYINCWAQSDLESEALWRLYTSSNEGVAIRTTYSKLINVIRNDDELFVGCVTYLDYDSQQFDNPWWPAGQNGFQPVMHKRLAFAHEQEIRIVKHLFNHWMPEAERPAGLTVSVDVIDLIEGIFISPYAPEWYAKVVHDVVDKFSPDLSTRVHWSRMKSEPLY